MTAAQPQIPLLTIDEYAALGETETGYTELLEGRVLVSPSPTAKHNCAALALAMQLVPQLREHLDVIPDLDVDLQLSPPGQPGWSRRPDHVTKRHEYADAGIGHYWIVDLDPESSA